MATLSANSSITVSLAANGILKINGQGGGYQVVPPAPASALNGMAQVNGSAVVGPFPFPISVYIFSGSTAFTYDFDWALDAYAKLISESPVIGLQQTPVSKSDLDTNEASLFTLDIPANTLTPLSALKIRSLWTVPSSAAAKRLRGRFGGTVLWNLDLTTHVSYPLEFVICNRNSVAAQIAQGNNVSWAVPLASNAVQTFTLDFGTAQQLTVTAQWPVAGAGSNNITLESIIVEHMRLPGA